jgi:GNAT superfamily N-acetyltransferase
MAEDRARSLDWYIVARVDPRRYPRLGAAMSARGWIPRGPRIAWVAAVEDLPDDARTPFSWRSTARTPAAALRAVLEAVVEGDPLRPPMGSPDAWLAGWLAAPGLVGAIQVGWLEGEPVALAGGQVDARTGFGRIPYAGLATEARRKGLGSWVFRRAFHLLRTHGATHWHGTTAAANQPVQALLRTWGIRPGGPIDEWLFVAPRAEPR